MSEPKVAILDDRGVLRLAGPEAESFLQGVISNDVTRVTTERALWSALLTPQGKYLHDFFLLREPGGEGLLLDCEAERRDDLKRRLTLYRLRAKATVEDATDAWAVAVLFGSNALEALGLPPEPGAAAPFGGGIACVDPRLASLGARALLPKAEAEETLNAAGFTRAERDEWDHLRLSLGVPDGSRDLEVERATLLESGFDELHGVDWHKGCFVGQELTARTKHRGLVKRRLLPVEIDGPLPTPGTPVLLDGRDAGTLRSAIPGADGSGGVGLALLRLEAVEQAGPGALSAGEARLTARKPDWARF